jgi:sarcosine oxidase
MGLEAGRFVERFDVVVIGAGGMGSAAAHYLARDGRRVLLVEQFSVGHSRGSSHGGSRIIRHSYVEREYASLAPHAFALWRQLQRESSARLLGDTGGLDFAPPDYPTLLGRMATLDNLGLPYRLYGRSELARDFPQFRLPSGWVALYQADAGILSATRCVQTLAAHAVKRGAVLRENSRVLSVLPDGAGVRAEIDGPAGRQTVLADQAVLAAGPWAGRFLDELGITAAYAAPLRVTHQQLTYMEVSESARPLFAADRCPVYIGLPMPYFYGFPIWERPGQLKVGREMDDPAIDPDGERAVDADAVAEVEAWVAETLFGVIPKAVSTEKCLYTVSPDGHFLIDRHPEHPQILLAAGFSGRGFKFVVTTGRLLADLAASAPGDYSSPLWRENFRIDRFVNGQVQPSVDTANL